MSWYLLQLILGWSIWNPAYSRDVLVVLTPGLSFEEHHLLLDELSRQGHTLHVVGSSCVAANSDSIIAAIITKGNAIQADYTVVAHGIGGTLSLMAAPKIAADRYVLLGPVLDVVPSRALTFLVEQDVVTPLELSRQIVWNGRDLRAVLSGKEDDWEGCLSMGLARDIQDWIRRGDVPIPFEQIDSEVWIGLSLADEIGTVESSIPAARRLNRRRIVRFGLNRFDGRDYSHWELLSLPTPIRAAVHRVDGL